MNQEEDIVIERWTVRLCTPPKRTIPLMVKFRRKVSAHPDVYDAKENL